MERNLKTFIWDIFFLLLFLKKVSGDQQIFQLGWVFLNLINGGYYFYIGFPQRDPRERKPTQYKNKFNLKEMEGEKVGE